MVDFRTRTQVAIQAGAIVIMLGLVTWALFQVTNQSDEASAGAAACVNQVENFSSSREFRRVTKAEFETNGRIRAQTAEAFRGIAELTSPGSKARRALLALANEYDEAASRSYMHAGGVVLPDKPDCAS